MTISALQPGQVFPEIIIPQLGGGSINVGKPENGHDWKMVVVYRGKHCPLCTQYLQELNQELEKFHELKVDVLALSADSVERATSQIAEVDPNYPVGYDLSIEQMQAMGLYISDAKVGMDAERPFAEPGLFVINDEGNLQMIDISNVPFARPSISSMLMGLNYIRNLTETFPVSGSYTV